MFQTPMPLQAWIAATAGFSVATVFGLCANQLLEASGSNQDEELLDGFPRSRWLLSVVIQALIFPALCFASINSSRAVGLSFVQYLKAPSWALPVRARWYVYSLFGSQARDMLPMPAEASTLMKVHHWVVVCACVLALMAPKGFGLFTASTFVLECGSMMYNLRVLYPGSRMISVLYQVVMLASNSVSMLCGIFFLKISEVPLWYRVLFFVADVGVCLGRPACSQGCRDHRPYGGQSFNQGFSFRIPGSSCSGNLCDWAAQGFLPESQNEGGWQKSLLVMGWHSRSGSCSSQPTVVSFAFDFLAGTFVSDSSQDAWVAQRPSSDTDRLTSEPLIGFEAPGGLTKRG